MAKEQLTSPGDFISKKIAFAHSLIESAKFVLATIPDISKSDGYILHHKALEIYDMNEQILFYDFTLQTRRSKVATVRAAANTALGKPVVSIRLGAQKWDLEKSKAQIFEIVKKNYPQYKVIGSLLVCYGYPKIGLKVSLINAKDKLRLVFDISDYSIIPEKLEKENYEGVFCWSFIDSIDKQSIESKRKKFQFAEDVAKKIFGKEYGTETLYKMGNLNRLIDLSKLFLITKIEKKLQFCNHYSHSEEGSHHCFILHAQQVNDYCSVATCQMILCYYRYYYAQNTIAPSLGYSTGSGCPADVSTGYESLSNNHLKATYDNSPKWIEARDQIDQLQPMKSGITGHARAVAGYSQNLFRILDSDNSDLKLLIYDPWPWNADLKAGGDIYWEDWDSITHTNFVFTKLDY